MPNHLRRKARKNRLGLTFERLESRQLLAADLLLDSDDSHFQSQVEKSFVAPPLSTAQLMAEGEDAGEAEGENGGEGEPAPDLVTFAKALADSGTQLYCAAWSAPCTAQRELFEDGGKFLPFVEVTNPDRTPNQAGIDAGVAQFPTWDFPDGNRVLGIQSLEELALNSGVPIPSSSIPSFEEVADVEVEVGSPFHIPIDAYDPNGNPLTITVSSSDPSLITAEVLSGNRSITFSTGGFGDMTFELFEGRAPVPSGRVVELAESGFYDGTIFHRVINDFVIQGGDPTGTGLGGSTLGSFDDQYHLDLQHNRTGVLSYAKSSDDTNDSQFFITEVPTRHLDFNHSIFGQLVEGEAVRQAISDTTTDFAGRPTNAVVIESTSVFDDIENGMLVLRAIEGGTGTATITVTVTDSESNSVSQTFEATVVADSADGAPFLNPLPEFETTVNTPVTVNLSSQDAEGSQVRYDAVALGSVPFGLEVDSETGVVTVTPPSGFRGELQFLARVFQTTSATTASQDDTQVVTVTVVGPDDLVAFAQTLSSAGTRFFCAAWSEPCTQQRELFEDGGSYLPFIEVTNPDRTLNQTGIDEGVNVFPTWEFADGTRLIGNQSLSDLASNAGVAIPSGTMPSFLEVADVDVEFRSPLHIPIDAYDPNGGPLTITVSSSDPDLITAEVLSGDNRSITFSTGGFGDMTFELFEGRAPVPSSRVIELAESGFYDGVIFHRVIDNFVIQGGDPTGTGTGGSTLGDFDDQFHLDLQHNRTGVLSYAKSTDDTNDSQFFVGEGPLRFLDFNHSVFGQLVEGEAVRQAISDTETSGSDRPVHDVVIESAEIFNDIENGMVVLRATGSAMGSATITVTVTDSESNSVSHTFVATVIEASVNANPFLNPISDVVTGIEVPVTVPLSSKDLEGDAPVYGATPVGTLDFGLDVDSATGIVTVTPPAGFSGELQFIASVMQETSVGSDTQLVTVNVGSPAQNPLSREDVNADGTVSPIDVLLIVNYLNNLTGSSSIDALPTGAAFLDVNGDRFVSPVDALIVVNFLNQDSGEGEAARASNDLQPDEYPSSLATPLLDELLADLEIRKKLRSGL